ncbi:hypothetical protein V6N13_000834 [Hibiscus sabdariffa]
MSFFVIGHFSQSQNLGFESEKEKFYSEFPDEGRRLSTIMVAIRGALLKHLRVSATSLPFLRNPNPTPNGLFALSSTNLRSPIASSMLSKSSRKLILPRQSRYWQNSVQRIEYRKMIWKREEGL